jgi:hypothetical protein
MARTLLPGLLGIASLLFSLGCQKKSRSQKGLPPGEYLELRYALKLGTGPDLLGQVDCKVLVLSAFRTRIAALHLDRVRVEPRSGGVSVLVPKALQSALPRLKGALSRQQTLSLQLVDEEAEPIRPLAQLLEQLQDPVKRKRLGEHLAAIFFDRGPDGSLRWRPRFAALDTVRVKRDDPFGPHGSQERQVFLRFPGGAREAVLGLLRAVQTQKPLHAYRWPQERQVLLGPAPDWSLKPGLRGRDLWRTWYVIRAAPVTGQDLSRAFADHDREGRPIVSFVFGAAGEAKFRKFTRENIKRRLAIVVEGEVASAPVIMSEIGARGQITLGANRSPKALAREAKQLAGLLRAGRCLPHVHLESTRTVRR